MEGSEMKKKGGIEETMSQEIETLKKKNKYMFFARRAKSDSEWGRYLPPQVRKKRYVYRSCGMTVFFQEKKRQFANYGLPNYLLGPKNLPILKQVSKGTRKLMLKIRPQSKNDGGEEEEYRKLREVIKGCHGLQTIHFYMHLDLSEQHLQNLNDVLKGLCAVRNVHFSFGDVIQIEDDELQELRGIVKRMTNLKQFGLLCDVRKVAAKELETFGKELKNLRVLKNIDLNFVRFESKVFEELGKGFKGMDLQGNVNMKFFELHGEKGKAHDREIKAMKLALGKCDFIPKLALEFNQWSKYDDRGVDAFRQNLKALHLLKNFQFCFTSEVSKEKQDAFIKDLPNLSSLETLYLDFSPANEPYEERFVLVSQALKKLQKLQSLKLVFDNFSEKGLTALSEIFEELPFLKNVDLFLYESRENPMVKKGFRALMNGLGKAKSLEKISLYLQNFPDVVDADFKQLTESLEKLTLLKDIALVFAQFPGLTEKGLKTIGESLKRIASLQSVGLNIGACRQVKKEAVVALAQSLKELPLLKRSFRFEFYTFS